VLVQQLINGLSLGAVYALIAVGFGMIFNVLKFSNFAHGGVITVTAYAGYYVAANLGWSFLPTLAVAILVGGLLAMLVELVGFRLIRRRGGSVIFYFVSSVTIGMLLENLMVIAGGPTFYAYPDMLAKASYPVLGASVSTVNLVMLAASTLALVTLTWVLYRTRTGVAIRAISADTVTAGLMGANVDTLIGVTFFVSGCLAGMTGMLLGMTQTLFPQLGRVVVKGFIAAVIGGLGSLGGAVIGGIFLGVVEVMLTATIGSGWAPVLLFLILLSFLAVRPQGIAGVIAQEKA